jgi:hypothetical protein
MHLHAQVEMDSMACRAVARSDKICQWRAAREHNYAHIRSNSAVSQNCTPGAHFTRSD